MPVLVVGDIAGQFDALVQLINSVPTMDEIVLVGDLNDRGPKSKQVIEWAMTTPNVITLQSNHGHLFTDFYRTCTDTKYKPVYSFITDFMGNGGMATLKSYGYGEDEVRSTVNHLIEWMRSGTIPLDHIEWLESRPLCHITGDGSLFVSHAPWMGNMPTIVHSKEEQLLVPLIWNREPPVKMEGRVQVFGHNSNWGIKKFDDWAVCIDSSASSKLSGFVWPSRAIVQINFGKGKIVENVQL